MNDKLKNFAKEELKLGLAKLPEGWQRRFKQMYSHGNLDADINDVVDNMPEDKIDWAMQQVERSLEKQLSSAPKEECGSAFTVHNNRMFPFGKVDMRLYQTATYFPVVRKNWRTIL